MYSGGGRKTKYERICVELPEDKAVEWFKDKFKRDPTHTTCDCCGCDYSISEAETLEELTASLRDCKYSGDGYSEEQDLERPWTKYVPLGEYMQRTDVLIVASPL